MVKSGEARGAGQAFSLNTSMYWHGPVCLCVCVCSSVLGLVLPSFKLAKRIKQRFFFFFLKSLRNGDFSSLVTFINRWVFIMEHMLHGTCFSHSEELRLCMNLLIFMGLLFCSVQRNDTASFTVW